MVVAAVLATLAGVASFISPCVLPLVPGYLSFVSGVSVDSLNEHKGRVMTASLLFVLGFAAVFVTMGASASLFGQFLNTYRTVIERIGGVFVIVFGLALIGVVDLPFFSGGVAAGNRRYGMAGALPLGMTFAIAWTPCVTYNLAPILLLASRAQTVIKGAVLLSFYAAGLGIPFILTGAFFSKASGVLMWLGKHKTTVSWVAGSLLIAMGLLMLSGRLGQLSIYMQKIFPAYEVRL
ncbi:MAG: cytochrome c biogenesis protein CcdA [Chloroflexi bacterium]|nr:cytochrome c biogenesis protein CcdA [Chloroflexota bacterium]